MPVDIEIDLPDHVHERLLREAAREDISLQAYLLRWLRIIAAQPVPRDLRRDSLDATNSKN